MTLPDTIDCGWQSDAALIRMRSRANAGAVDCFGISAGMANVSMDIIADLELEYEERCRNKLVDAFENECRNVNAARGKAVERRRIAQSDEDKRRLAQDIAQLERIASDYMVKIAAYKAMDVHTNVMFKVMTRAEAVQKSCK